MTASPAQTARTWPTPPGLADASDSLRTFVAFDLGNQTLAADVTEVREILDLQEISPLPELRGRASFVTANLLQDLDGSVPLADVVFLRNVLICFTAEDRQKALAHVMHRMRQGAYRLMGHSDNLQTLPKGLVPCGTAVFRKD